MRRVGLRIAEKAQDGAGGGYVEHMKNLQWEFAVIKCGSSLSVRQMRWQARSIYFD